jgi:hypothetical protein
MSHYRVSPEKTQARPQELISYERLKELVSTWKNSPRVQVRTVGQTREGRDIVSIIISSPENILSLSQLQQEGKKLTTPVATHRSLNEVDVRFESAVPENPVTSVLIEGGGFGMEVAHVEGLVSLTEHLIKSDDPNVLKILEKNIVVVMPDINPDGRRLAIEEWKRTRFSPGSAGFGNAYGFTLNRDLANLTQPEGRAVLSAERDWGLVAVYDPHEDMALLGVSHGEVCWCPPYNDRPYPPEYDPRIMELSDELGAAIAEEWEKEGFDYLYDPVGHKGLLSFVTGPLTGCVHMVMVQHGIPAVITESARTPGTQLWEDRVRQKYSAAMGILKKVTREQERYLAVVRAARSEIPDCKENAAYIVPENQKDRSVLEEFLNVLSQHEMAVYYTETPYPAYVVPFRQPRIQVAHTLFSNGDLSAQILCPDYGIEAYVLTDRPKEEQEAFAKSSLRRVNGLVKKGILTFGEGKGKLAFPNCYSGIILANRLLKAGNSVSRLLNQVSPPLSTGSYLIDEDLLDPAKELAGKLSIDLVRMEGSDGGSAKPISMPRIGVYVGEGIGHLNMAHLADIVWSLDVLEFPYERIDREALLGGALDRVEVLIVPGGDGQEMIEGLNPANPWHKEPWEPPVPVGQGMGSEGVAVIKRFVIGGGKYLGIGMGGGWFAAKDLSGLMDVTTTRSPLGSGTAYLALQNLDHLLLAGYAGVTRRDGKVQADRATAYFYCPPPYFKDAGMSPLFVATGDAQLIAAFDESLAPESQSEEAKKAYRGKGAIVTQQIGKGRATVVGVNIGFRAVWYSTHPLLANAIYDQS